MFRGAILATFFFFLQVRASIADSPRIIIVGSGAAGVAAASRLLQNGFSNVTILEAENRIGGRVYTMRFETVYANIPMSPDKIRKSAIGAANTPNSNVSDFYRWLQDTIGPLQQADYWVDVGGQWVHGEEDNVVYELAWRLGVFRHSTFPKHIGLFSSTGSMLPQTVADDLVDFFFNVTNAKPSESNPTRSMGQFYKFNERLEAQPELSFDQRKSLAHMFDLFQMTADAGQSWFNVSAYHEDISCSGDQAMNWKDQGYNMILDILMKKFPDPDKEIPVKNKTILGAEVSEIDYNVPHGAVRVSTTNGIEYYAEHVIVTVSLGVLKADHEELFKPALPEIKVNTIEGLQLGNVAKIFLYYSEPWWGNETFAFFNLYWTEEDRKALENDSEKSWLLSVVTVVSVEHKPRLLRFWLTGPHAREMESVPEDHVFDQIKELLRRFLGRTYDLTEPSSMLRSKWFTNKHFRGTWSYRNLETERLGARAVDLQEPIMHDGVLLVLFAGEATSTKHSATVNGAIGTGWREANRLIKLYGRQKSTKDRVKHGEFSTFATIVVP